MDVCLYFVDASFDIWRHKNVIAYVSVLNVRRIVLQINIFRDLFGVLHRFFLLIFVVFRCSFVYEMDTDNSGSEVYSGSEIDPFESDDDDQEYVPVDELSSSEDEYESDDSEIDFLEQSDRENMIIEPNSALFSKDGSIEYSREPLPPSRPSTAGNIADRNKGKMLFFVVVSPVVCVMWCVMCFV